MGKLEQYQAQRKSATDGADHHLIGAVMTIAALAITILVVASIKLHGG